MSFSPPFKDVFEPGDLVYGDQYDRTFFLLSGIVDPLYFNKQFDMKLTPQTPFTTFQGRTQYGKQLRIPPIIDDMNNYLSDYEKKQEGKIAKIRAGLFYVTEDLAVRFNKYLHDSAYNKDKLNKPSLKFDWEYHRIKEQCKAGLDFQTRGKGIDGKGEGIIHFVLGPILLQLMEYIVGKSNPVLDKYILHYTGEKSRPFVTEKRRHITGAEIRWVYRNRKDPKLQAKIQFWRVVGKQNEKLYSIETLKAKEDINKIMNDAVWKHLKTQKDNITSKKAVTNIFDPCYPPWTPQFSINTAVLWEQYKPKHEYDEPEVFIQELKKDYRKFTVSSTDPGTKNSHRKFTIDDRKF
jgi:hypothetical protein